MVYGVHMATKSGRPATKGSVAGTADRIVAATLAIVTDEGVGAVTMRRVAADAGVTAMATYRHFPNRAALLRAAAEAAGAALGEDWGTRCRDSDFETRFADLLEEFLDFALGKPNLYSFLITERREGARRFPEDFREGASPAFAPLVEVVEQGMSAGGLRDDDALEVAMAINASAVGLVQLYLAGRIGCSEKEFRALCKRSMGRMLNGLKQ